MKKRALSWLLALTMLLTLAPQTLPVWASATGEKSSTATQTESKLSANTYSALGLSRNNVDTSSLPEGEQPYGKAVEGNTVATNVINELYVNFNGSIHYGWSILNDIPMEHVTGIADNKWNDPSNFQGAMGYWRPGQQGVHYKTGASSYGALFTKDGKWLTAHNEKIGDVTSKSISSANKHLVYQYSKSEAFSPNTGKDNYVAEIVLDTNNDVWLYIYQVEDGNKRYVRGVKVVTDSFAGNKSTVIWNWEYDAMYDIAAGDMDGDGYDEIAVYASNKVYLYNYKNNSLKEVKSTVSPSNSKASQDKYKKLGTAVVTLAFGDLDEDNNEELVIAENMTYGSSNVTDGKVGIYGLRREATPENGETYRLEEETTPISLKVGDNTLVRYANVATGDIDGDYKDELIIAGYQSDNGSNATCKNGETNTISYMIVKGKDYKNSGWKTADQKIDLLRRVVDNKEQLIPPVSLTCAATQGVGYAEQLFMAGSLYSVKTNKAANEDYQPSQYGLEYLTRISTNREYKKDNGDKANKEEIFVVNVVAGNFNGNRHGQEQIVYAFGMKHDDSDRYWYDIGYINKKATGTENEKSPNGYWYGQEQVMNYESSYNRDNNKRRASLYLSLAAVDCDNDSTLVRYKGQEITWTKPEVLTVLQSAPYFQDLQDTRDYLNQAQTAYGKGYGENQTVTTGASLSLGTYVSFEQDFSVFGVKIASIEAEAQSKHSFEYGFESTQTKSVDITYSGSAGDDYAVVYAVPYVEYQYETWVPGYEIPKNESEYTNWKNKYVSDYLTGKNKNWASGLSEQQKKDKIDATANELGLTAGKKVAGSWQPSTVSVPMTPQKVLISVDAYDEIAEQTEGLEPIRGNILNSTPGEPSTYDSFGSRSDFFEQIGQDQAVTTSQGGNVSVGGQSATDKQHTFNYSYEFEAKAGVGAGGLTVGVLAGFGTNVGGGVGTSSSRSCVATVDNLPSDASGYSFNWRFGTRKAELNGNPVLVLEYQLDNVKQLPSPPRNLRVEEVTSNSVTLGWDAVPGAGAYEVYQISTTTAGQKRLRATVPGTATSYTDQNVNPNNTYKYCIKNVTKGGTSSIFSTEVQASTLTDSNGRFIIKQQPGTDNIFGTYVGGITTATVQAEYLDKNDQEKPLSYYWETYNTKTKRWEDCPGGAGSTLTISDVKEAMDGNKYRCQVYYDANLYLYTEPVTLRIGKADSTTTLRSDKTNQTVNASYVKTEPVETGEEKEVPQKEMIGGSEYTVYTANGETLYLGENGQYYTKAGEKLTNRPVTSVNIQLTYNVKAENTGSEGDGTETSKIETILFTELNETTKPSTIDVTYTNADEEGGNTTYSACKVLKAYQTSNEASAVKVYKCETQIVNPKSSQAGEPPTIPMEFWVVQTSDNKQYSADVETQNIIKIDQKEIKVDELVQKTVKEKVTKIQQTTMPGEQVTLTANVNDANTQAPGPAGNVVFKIVNSVGEGSGTVTGKITDGVATATWKPSVAGVYTITAAYEGSEIHMGSASAGSITINVVVPGEKKLVIDSPNSMTYGDAAIDLKATLLSGADGSGTGSAAPVTATYSVKDAAGNTVSNAIAENKFAPKAAGNYTITATCTVDGKSFTATKTINVSKRTVKIVPKVENNVTSYTLENIVSTDQSLFKGKINVTCAGVTTGAAAGQYPINVTYTPGTDDNAKTIDSRYLVILDTTQVYTVSDDVVQVTNATNSNNGTVTLQYTVTNTTGSNTFNLGNGTEVPKGAKLTATASPHKGYKVKKWIVNGNPVYLNGTGGTLNTAPTIIVADKVQPTNAADKGYTVTAEFEAVNYTLAFEVEDGKGTVKAHYMNGATEGSPFANKSGLSPLDTVQLTAKVNDGYSIKGWEITTGSSKTEIIQENGKNYTGSSYKLSSISADTKVTVLVESTTEQKVSIALVNSKEDGNTEPLTIEGAKVTFITEEGTQNVTPANSIYIYQANKHDNLTVQITLPNGWIVDEWTDSAGNAMQDNNLSNDKKSWKVSDLSENFTWTVKCKTPNSYKVTTKTMLGETEDTVGGTITVYKVGTDETVTSGSPVLQATGLRVKVNPNSGYQLMDVALYDGETKIKDLGQNSDFTIDSVNSNINIVANFVKKPVIKITTPTNGTVTANGMELSESTVPYGSTKDIVFTATPKVGYEVDTWKVKVGDANPITLTSDQITKVANSDNQTYTYTPNAETGITSDLTVTVSFKAIPSVTVNFSVFDKILDAEGGTDGTLTASVTRKGMDGYKVEDFNTGSLTVYRDSVVRFTATPDSGYKVGVWQLNGDKWENQPELSITSKITSPQNVQVQFDLIGDKVTYGFRSDGASDKAQISAKYTPNGSTEEQNFTTGATPEENGKITFTVSELDTGYEIEGWYVDGMKQDGETGATFTHAVTKGVGVEVQAKIIRKSYQVKFSAINGTVGATVDGGSITSGTSVDGDKQVTFTATPVSNTGYTFAGWTVNGDEQDNMSTTLTLTITQATTVSAKFTLNTVSYAVNYGVVGTETDRHGTLTAKVGSQTFTSGEPKPADSTVVFTAQPESGYRVKGWYSNEGGTTAIDGTKVEQETYTIDSLTAEANVYVAFEKIPTYEITVTTTGLGHVTAKVNHVDAEITGGKLTVNHHDNVVFTAVPDTKQNLTNWTLDGDNKGNSSMTLTLNDVTAMHTVTANFVTSQRITFRTILGPNGTLIAKAGDNTSLETIDASSTTGIQVDNGKKIVLTAKPDNGKAVVWTVNNQPTNELSNTYTIDAISENTTVKADFVALELCTIPQNSDTSADYTISEVTKYPKDYGTDGQIRKGGTVSFKLTPKKPVMGLQGLPENAKVVYNSDGSYTVTVTNVTSNIAVTATAYQVEAKGLNDYVVPKSLKDVNLNSITDIKTKLETNLTGRKNGTVFYDIVLKTADGNVVSGDNFPANGVYVTIPYPTGTDKQDTFQILHMLTATKDGKQPGDVEEITPIKKNEDSISFHVTSLSPFAIGWTKYVAPTPGGGGGGGGGVVSAYTLTFDTNGGSAIDKITKDSGTTIDLAAYKPTRAGYTFAGWFSDKALTKAVTSVKLTANTTVYAKWTQNGTAQNPFVDVKEGAYYYDAILWAVEQKITSGTSATTFSPDASCTRAQMVTFLWRAAGSPKVENGKNPFTDVKADAYYYDAVLWAVEKGVTSGTSATTFSPDATVTRGQTVTFLYRNAGSPEVSGTMPFTDVEADAYYAKAVQWAVQQKITTGTSETTFSPMSDCTRGQIVTFLYRAK